VRESILAKDTEMQFPHVAVLKASAGSGKTHNLTRRFVQFLLSAKVPRSSLRNILAMTFSNNAAREMRERTLSWLKKLHFGDGEKIRDLMEILSLDPEGIKDKTGLLIDDILDSYSDFQVRTIDSFMTTVFKASAIDFGYNPDFEVLMSIDSLMDYSFDLFLKNAKEGTAEAGFLGDIVDIILEQKKYEIELSALQETLKLKRAAVDEALKLYGRDSQEYKKACVEKQNAEAAVTDAAIAENKRRIQAAEEAYKQQVQDNYDAQKKIIEATAEGFSQREQFIKRQDEIAAIIGVKDAEDAETEALKRNKNQKYLLYMQTDELVSRYAILFGEDSENYKAAVKEKQKAL